MTTLVRVAQAAPTVVRVQLVDNSVELVERSATVVRITGVEAAGPRGPQGDPGDIGPTGLSAYEVALLEGFIGTEEQWLESLIGPQGLAGGSYTHNQLATSTTWVVVHNLGYYPNVTCFDSGGTEFWADITHDSVNQLTISLASAISGVVYVS